MKWVGRVGELLAEEFLKENGYAVWRPDQFIKLLEMAALYRVVSGECKTEPKVPLRISIPTKSGYVSVVYWRGNCIDIDAVEATEIERSLYAPCVKKCIEKTLGEFVKLAETAETLLEHRRVLKSIDLFAYKDGVFFAVEVKTNSGKLSSIQREKTIVLRQLKHLVVHVYLQNPLVEIEYL
ncbi:MAG: hypothetical protein QW680_03590 [Pyrobaculum sp.]